MLVEMSSAKLDNVGNSDASKRGSGSSDQDGASEFVAENRTLETPGPLWYSFKRQLLGVDVVSGIYLASVL
jgi:hypothetical protein